MVKLSLPELAAKAWFDRKDFNSQEPLTQSSRSQAASSATKATAPIMRSTFTYLKKILIKSRIGINEVDALKYF